MIPPTEYEIREKFHEEYGDEYLARHDPMVVKKMWVAYAKGFCDGGMDALKRIKR
jgi:hypothetical protein